MEIQVRVIDILQEQGGISAAGKSWKLQTFIAETMDNVVKTIAFDILGEQRIKDNPVEIGGIYNVSFDLESREYNFRWYTNAKAWKIVPAQQIEAQPVDQHQEYMAVQPENFDNAQQSQIGDKLPF